MREFTSCAVCHTEFNFLEGYGIYEEAETFTYVVCDDCYGQIVPLTWVMVNIEDDEVQM